jgi:sn-glycerol 3-phosphate transport system ATP-binding protein
MTAEIRVADMVKRWDDTVAVDTVSFTVPPSGLTVLLGPSGCGKSTLLRLIAGLETPTAGRIAIDGRDVTSVDPAHRGVSMVFQSYALFPHLSVRDNIEFGLRVRKTDRATRERRCAEAAAMVDLTAFLDRKPNQLSGGQRQRVALARAIVSQQPVCLMDEPLSNLDAKLRAVMRSEIRRLQQSLGLTMVYVTHDQIEAMTMADQIILLNDGRIEQQGTPFDLYERPATVFAAQFIGAPPMNMVDVSAREAPWLAAIGLGETRRRIGVRPEHVVLGADGIEATVSAVDYHGVETIVSLHHAYGETLARSGGSTAPSLGERIHIQWAPEHAHVFDAQGIRRNAP